MSRANQAFILVTITIVGIWGCAQGEPSPGASAADRVKALENKSAKLEEDFRAVAAVRDQLRRKLAAAEEQQQRLKRELEEEIQTITKERDELRQQLAARTTERDTMTTQFEQFRNSLKELIGQAEAALPRTGDAIGAATEAAEPVDSAAEVSDTEKVPGEEPAEDNG